MAYIDKKIVVSAAIGSALFGAAVYFMKRSGVGIAGDAARVAQGG